MGPLPAIPTKCVFHIKYINVEISGLRTAHRLKWFGPVCGSTPFPNLAKPCRSSASGKKCGGRHHIRVVRYCTYIMICVMWFVIYLNYIYIYNVYSNRHRRSISYCSSAFDTNFCDGNERQSSKKDFLI